MHSTIVCSCGVQAQVWVQVQGCLLPVEFSQTAGPPSPGSRLSFLFLLPTFSFPPCP